MILLAIGLRYDEGIGRVHSFSRHTTTAAPQVVSDMLHKEDGGEPFEQILIVKSARVIEHWNRGKDYDIGAEE